MKAFVVTIAISAGSWLGWMLGSAGGLMVAYLSAVVGASVGLYFGRKIQRNMDI